jgi:aminoglycoside 6'-N-acetyltransferase
MRFRPLARHDFGLLGSWIAAPHVAPWWREDASPEAVEAAYGPPVDGADPTELFVVEIDGEAAAFVQRYRYGDNPAWEAAIGATGAVGVSAAAGIDYLIGVPDLTGAGVGPLVIDRFTQDTLARYPDAEAVVVAVQQANRRSWRALEKAGFTRVFAGTITSDDPSDEGPSFVYERRR